MPDEAQLAATFDHLVDVFAPYRSTLLTKSDAPGDFYLDAPPSLTYPQGLFFGAVKIGKRYVSFHLMPLYVHPELFDIISPELRKRMQGKSCFNFTKPDETLFAELADLTAAGFKAYERDGTTSPLTARR
jgi:hypothetical protein